MTRLSRNTNSSSASKTLLHQQAIRTTHNTIEIDKVAEECKKDFLRQIIKQRLKQKNQTKGDIRIFNNVRINQLATTSSGIQKTDSGATSYSFSNKRASEATIARSRSRNN